MDKYIKEEKMELPQPPVFYEDDYPYPWKPSKSSGGTGDAPADWIEPSTTVEPTPQPVQPKLCPFRKKIYAKADLSDGSSTQATIKYANHFEEEFQPCLREQCAVWNKRMGECAY